MVPIGNVEFVPYFDVEDGKGLELRDLAIVDRRQTDAPIVSRGRETMLVQTEDRSYRL
jgi:hypothetical protein